MQTCATYDDVHLVLKLYELRREERMRDARRWFTANFHAKDMSEFETLCPAGSTENESFRMVVTYWDMAASFVKLGVLQPDAFFESGREILVVWERIRDLLPAMREARQDPAALSNLETVAKSCIEWWEAKAPGAHEAFSNRIRG